MTTIPGIGLPAGVTATETLHFVNKELKLTASRTSTVAAKTPRFIAVSADTVEVTKLRRLRNLFFTLAIISLALLVTAAILMATGGAAGVIVIPAVIGAVMTSSWHCFAGLNSEINKLLLFRQMDEVKNETALQQTLQHAIRDADMKELRELAKYQEFVTRYKLEQALKDRFDVAEGNIPAAVPVVIAA